MQIWQWLGEYNGVRKVEYIVLYLLARMNADKKEVLYKAYITDTLKAVFKVSGNRWFEDAYQTTPLKPKPKQSADEILKSLIERGGLVAKNGFT